MFSEELASLEKDLLGENSVSAARQRLRSLVNRGTVPNKWHPHTMTAPAIVNPAHDNSHRSLIRAPQLQQDGGRLTRHSRPDRQRSISPSQDIDAIEDVVPQPGRIQGESILHYLTPPPLTLRRQGPSLTKSVLFHVSITYIAPFCIKYSTVLPVQLFS